MLNTKIATVPCVLVGSTECHRTFPKSLATYTDTKHNTWANGLLIELNEQARVKLGETLYAGDFREMISKYKHPEESLWVTYNTKEVGSVDYAK